MGIDRSISVRTAALVGLASLAAAMGIGRFAFTPILPMMQETLGVTLVEGAWLATANYAGYLLGACVSFVLTPKAGVSAKWGLLVVAVATLAMAGTTSLISWLCLRFVAGVASAFVLVGASAWSLAHLASYRRSDLAGYVFAGVGIGIAVAGALALCTAVSGGTSAQAWGALGIVALAVALCTWTTFATVKPAARIDPATVVTPLDRGSWLLVGCYGAFGFGYIVPATFIPATARTLVSDPLVFGWAWPIFGLAAAISTVLVATLFRSTAPRRVAAASLFVMAAGVAAPAIDKSLGALLASALCVGGTFMVMTMAGVQEARRISSGDATKLISALTAAFALGQLAGPVLVSLSRSAANGLMLVSSLAAALLASSALALLCFHHDAPSRTEPLPRQRTP